MTQDEIIEPQLKTATPKAKLLVDLMSANIPKTETEWAAKEHVEYLIETIELLKAKLAELEQPTPSQSVDEPCEINSVSSRVCEKGSKSCTVYHAKPQPTSQDSDIVYITDDGYEVSRKEYAEFKQWIAMKASPKG